MFDCSKYINRIVKSLDDLHDICNDIVGPDPMSSWYCGAVKSEGDIILVEVWKECNRFMCFEPDRLRGYMVFRVRKVDNGYVITNCYYEEEH